MSPASPQHLASTQRIASKSSLGVGPSMKSLNYVNKKRDLEKILQQNALLLKKINFAEPSVQHSEHKEHAKTVKKLKELV